MKILVVGGAGYIGAHVVKALLNAGISVRVYDDLSTGQKINLFPQIEFVENTILNEKALEEAVTDVDGVIHLAAKKAVGESMTLPEIYATNNITGTLNLLNAMAKKNVKNIVFSSSAAVYGTPQYTKVDEAHPVNPINFYGFTKLEIERFLEWYDRLKDIKFIALRYFNAVGYDETGAVQGLEKNPQNLLPIIMETIVGIREKMLIFGTDYDTPDGTCIRDYIHVSDLATAHVSALNYLLKEHKSQVLNLGTETGHSVLEMVKRTEALIKPFPHENAPRRPGDPAQLTAVAHKAHTLLGWTPTHSALDNIILSTWALYQKHFPQNR